MVDRVEPGLVEVVRDPPPDRLRTADQRRLPDFVIIGAQRAGTTSLYRYLCEHPDVAPAWRKEVHFLERHYDKGIDWYRAHFPLREEAAVVGEASPNYLFHPAVPSRARLILPNARFIALLRDPVARAYSHYQMKVRRGIETLPFTEAIDKEGERLGGDDDPTGLAWRHFSYVSRGEYVDHLERWLAVFPRHQLIVIKSEEFFAEPGCVLRGALADLGLPVWTPKGFRAYHLAEYDEMDGATRERLAAHFAPFNRRLYDLLGRDLGWDDGR